MSPSYVLNDESIAMYKLVFYGLMASPPTKAHQAILKQLVETHPQKPFTIDYHSLCTVRNEANDIVFCGTLESLGLSGQVNDIESTERERCIKRALAKRDCIDYTEICCVLSADGPPVLDKSPSTHHVHRLNMLKMAAAEVDETRIMVSDMEIVLSQLTGLPSYTANTLMVLRDGLQGLLDNPQNLLTPDEAKKPASAKAMLLAQRSAAILHYLEHSTHAWLTPRGVVDPASAITLVMGSDAYNSLDRWFDSPRVVAYVNEIKVADREGSKPFEDVSNYSSTGFRDQIAIHEIKAGRLAGLDHDGDSARLSWVSPKILEYVRANRLYMPLISVITDSEGNLQHFLSSASMSDTLIQRLNEQGMAQNAPKISLFLGDTCDKGPDDLRVLHTIRHRVCQLKEKWLLIAGNRDDNKIRLLELLNSKYIHDFVQQPGVYWNPIKTAPAAFCENLNVDFEALDIHSKRVVVLKWMLEKTMGAPNAFENRRIELQALLKTPLADITDISVMKSFIEEMLKPEEYALLSNMQGFEDGRWVLPEAYRGDMRWYIENSQAMALIGNTFYSHAGLPKGVFPYLQSGEQLPVIATREGFMQWVEARNTERKTNINAYIQGMLTQKIFGVSPHPAVQASLYHEPFQAGVANNRAYNIQSFDSFSHAQDADVLNACGIETMLHGHQYALTETPRVTRSKSRVIVNVDTRLGEGACTLFPNGTIVLANRVFCLSQHRNEAYFLSDSADAMMGSTLNIKNSVTGEYHLYTVIAEELCPSGQKRYLLVCYEKKGSSRFYSVDPVYGALFVVLPNHLLNGRTTQTLVFMVEDNVLTGGDGALWA